METEAGSLETTWKKSPKVRVFMCSHPATPPSPPLPLSDSDGGTGGAEDDAHHYHKLVVLDLLESERAYVQDLNVCGVPRPPSRNTFFISLVLSTEFVIDISVSPEERKCVSFLASGHDLLVYGLNGGP